MYARENEYELEFIAANRSYGRFHREFGDSILRIKQLGAYSRMIMLFGSEEKTVVNASKYPVLIRIDPQKIKLKQRSNGSYILLKSNLRE
ncbi:hypothetical protein D3C73_917980 [compost metagenome]